MNRKAQGSIEYLLLVAGAMVVVAAIIFIMTNAPTSGPAPECAVECGGIALTAIDRESECNSHVMEKDICQGKCIWRQDECDYEQCEGPGCGPA